MAQGRRPCRRPRAVRGLRGLAKPAAPAAPKAAAGFLPGHVSFGVLAPLSGPHGERGRDLVDGARLAVADLNVRGGVNGQRVGIVADDDGCERRAGRAGARRLREREIAGALGGICASAAGAPRRARSAPACRSSSRRPTRRGSSAPERTPTAYLTSGTPYQSALADRPLARVPDRAAALRRDRGRSRLALPRPAGAGARRRRPRRRSRSRRCRPGRPLAHDRRRRRWPATRTSCTGPARRPGGGSLLAALRDGRLRGRVRRLRGLREPGVPGRRRRGGGGRVRDRARRRRRTCPRRRTGPRASRSASVTRPAATRCRPMRALRALAHAVTQSGKVDAERNAPSWRGSTRATRRSSAARRSVRVRPHDQVRRQHRADGQRRRVHGREPAALGVVMRAAALLVVLCVLAAGCGADGPSRYSVGDVKAAYYTRRRTPAAGGHDRGLLGRRRVPLARELRAARGARDVPADAARERAAAGRRT